MRRLRWFVTIVEELIHRHFQSPRKFFEGFYSRDRVAVFYTGDIATRQTRPFLNMALREFLLFA